MGDTELQSIQKETGGEADAYENCAAENATVHRASDGRDWWSYPYKQARRFLYGTEEEKPDFRKAMPLLRMEARGGNGYACYDLGRMHKQHWKSSSYAAACGVSDKVLWKTMEGRPFIRNVCICLDNDETGQRVAQRISKALTEKNIRNQILVPTRKDWNEDLLFLRKPANKKSSPKADLTEEKFAGSR